MKGITLILLIFISDSLYASPFAKPSEASGILNMSIARPAANIFPVTLYAIDGKQIVNRNSAVWLTPGEHTISVNAIIDISNRRSSLLRRYKTNKQVENNQIKITVEDGKIYYVGFDANDSDPNKWRPVIWKVKD